MAKLKRNPSHGSTHAKGSSSKSETAELMINELGYRVALLLRGSGLDTVAANIQEATLLSILIERSAKVQYMASAIGDARQLSMLICRDNSAACRLIFLNRPGTTTYPRQVDTTAPSRRGAVTIALLLQRNEKKYADWDKLMQ